MGDTIGTVAELWRFPVKSMQGFPTDQVVVGPDRIEGDREWAVVDPAEGKVLSAKRWGKLLLASASVDDGTVVVTLPDGSSHPAGDPATDAALSAFLDRDVRMQPPSAGDGMPYDVPYEAWEPDTSDVWQFPGPPGGPFVDLAAAHVLTTASLRAAAGLHPDGEWDVRRFRPMAVLDVEGEGFVEDEWVGTPVALGADVVLDPFMPTVRCAMITRAQPGLGPDPEIARTLNREHGLNLGLYCAISAPGTVAVGDPVQLRP